MRRPSPWGHQHRASPNSRAAEVVGGWIENSKVGIATEFVALIEAQLVILICSCEVGLIALSDRRGDNGPRRSGPGTAIRQ